MSNWVKASEDMPKVGRVVILRSPFTTYDENNTEVNYLEYTAGLVESDKIGRRYVSVAGREYKASFLHGTEWQYLDE